jgi:adenylate cyclase class 2
VTTDSNQNQLEVEIKLKLAEGDESRLVPLALEMGFRKVEDDVFENNVVFDTPDRELKKRKMLLRLRQKDECTILTMKRPPGRDLDSDDYKIREEIEVDVSDFENARTIITALGYEVFFIYQKYRTVFRKDTDQGPVELMMDRTPIGHYLEIEGPASQIDSIAGRLGFSKGDYITANYYKLFRKEHKTGFMRFE